MHLRPMRRVQGQGGGVIGSLGGVPRCVPDALRTGEGAGVGDESNHMFPVFTLTGLSGVPGRNVPLLRPPVLAR